MPDKGGILGFGILTGDLLGKRTSQSKGNPLSYSEIERNLLGHVTMILSFAEKHEYDMARLEMNRFFGLFAGALSHADISIFKSKYPGLVDVLHKDPTAWTDSDYATLRKYD